MHKWKKSINFLDTIGQEQQRHAYISTCSTVHFELAVSTNEHISGLWDEARYLDRTANMEVPLLTQDLLAGRHQPLFMMLLLSAKLHVPILENNSKRSKKIPIQEIPFSQTMYPHKKTQIS